ncbi:MAG TPA: PQQ-binding-like beta-propeller repeat protein [Gammaproteobacteria bacterium]|nr:PQQ-binding-like beta-propeller repeat protein [Gammaproteobacteria bacterium]
MMRTMTTRGRVLGITAFLLSAAASAQQGATNGQWRSYNGDSGATKYSALDQIDASNASRLKIAWRRPAVDASILEQMPGLRFGNSFRATPLMIDGVLYSPNGIGFVEAFDAGSGRTLWVEAPLDQGPNRYGGGSTRGAAYWTDGDDRRILVQRGEYLMALNAETGAHYPDFGDGGRVNLSKDLERGLTHTWSGVPFVVGDIAVIGHTTNDTFDSKEAARGDVRAYDVRTGELRWKFHVIPQQGEFGTDTWEDDSWIYSGHASVWSLFSADEELGYLYMPLSSATSDMYGGHRPGDNLFSQSLVCVDAQTGKRIWHYQTVHHDLWDFDLPAAPVLMDIEVGGESIKAVAQVTKQGFVFVFDRVTGEPVWPIEERPVPQSDVPGERTAATQPFPTKPPAFERQGSTADNLIDFTPELRAEALAIASRYTTGPLFTPPSIRDDGPDGNLGTIQLPGSQGGSNWHGAAFDPETQRFYVPSLIAPFVADIEPGDPAVTNLRYIKGTRLWMGGPQGLPLFKPPYGRITAFDMHAGEIVWQVANGDGPRDHPAIKHLNLGPLGNPGRAAPLLTKTLLFVGEGSPVMIVAFRIQPGQPLETAPSYGEPFFRAYDKDSGEVVAEIELPAGTTGAPMTYMHEGKQFIVVAVGGVEEPPEWVALSLP